MNNLNAAHEFINNMVEFGKLINDELKARTDFKEVKHAKLIDSYFHDYATKYTLKLVFNNFTATINFKLNGQSYDLSFVQREGRKVVNKFETYYSWAFDWSEAKDSVEAYGMLIKQTRELINNL